MNLISFILVYLPMAFLLFKCINPTGPGLLRLFRISRDLKSAAGMLRDRAYGSNLERRIRNDDVSVPEELFGEDILADQMEQYCKRITGMRLNPNDKCQTDIDEYFNFDLLEQQGKIELCEHTANGMTALGLLGTFLGLAGGLRSFGQDSSVQILAGISSLLDGMNTAFITSIFGILLSLILGYVLRIAVSDAEKHLNQFLTNFHNNVMRNQTETAFNELIMHIVRVESGLTASNEIQVNALDRVVSAFIAKLNEDLGLQINILRAAMHDMSTEQKSLNSAMQTLIRQLSDMGKQLNQVSSSFLPVLTQTATLAEQIESANSAMQVGLEQLHSMVNDDTAVLSRQQEITGQLLRTSQALEQVVASVQKQSIEAAQCTDTVAAHCKELAQNNNKVLSKCLADFTQTAIDVNNSIRNHGAEIIDTLHKHARETIRQLPQTGISADQVNSLLAQNRLVIKNQERLLQLMEHNLRDKKDKRSWRKKK